MKIERMGIFVANLHDKKIKCHTYKKIKTGINHELVFDSLNLIKKLD